MDNGILQQLSSFNFNKWFLSCVFCLFCFGELSLSKIDVAKVEKIDVAKVETVK